MQNDKNIGKDVIPAYNKVCAPAGLEIKTRRIFEMIVETEEAGFFKDSDVPLLVVYASLLVTWQAVTDRINSDFEKSGVLMFSPNGAPIMHPAIAAQCKITTAISGVCAKLKLSPSARLQTMRKSANVTLTRPADELDELFAGNEDLFLN